MARYRLPIAGRNASQHRFEMARFRETGRGGERTNANDIRELKAASFLPSPFLRCMGTAGTIEEGAMVDYSNARPHESESHTDRRTHIDTRLSPIRAHMLVGCQNWIFTRD